MRAASGDNKKRLVSGSAVALLAGCLTAPAMAADSAEELAKKLANPISSMVSVPLQFNYDRGMGPHDDGRRALLNVQPVVPFALNDDWNLISRTIAPIIWQDKVVPGEGNQFGLGDVTQSLFFSPRDSANGLTWGVGPAFLLPTSTESTLGTRKWAAGPTGVVLKQDGPWTVGFLANHLWSFAGDSNRNRIDATFMQPFVNYTTPAAVSYFAQTETTYDWQARQWTVPLIAGVSKVYDFNGQKVSLGAAVRYWAESPNGSPDGWGLRLVATFLFAK